MWTWLASASALLLWTTAAAWGGAYHATPLSEASDTNSLNPAVALSNAPLKRLPDGAFALGLVRLDSQAHSLRFPATVNMSEGQVEYAVVRSTGKVHESVLKTEAHPLHIHLGRLLVEPKSNEGPRAAARPGAAAELNGPRVRISVQWTIGSTEKRVDLEDFVTNTVTRAQMTKGDWVFSGSRVVQGTYLAERDGSIVAIIADLDAVVNNPRPGRDDDEIWKANSSLIPPIGTPVEVTIQLQPKEK